MRETVYINSFNERSLIDRARSFDGDLPAPYLQISTFSAYTDNEVYIDNECATSFEHSTSLLDGCYVREYRRQVSLEMWQFKHRHYYYSNRSDG
jgi:hypothetical protein